MLSPGDFDYICRLVLERSAIVLEPGKEYLVELRLKPLVRACGLADIGGLVQKLRTDRSGDLQREVVDAMTTNETSFFRDVHPFDTLRKIILPEMIRLRSTERALNLWCAAASSGQEIYSICMLIREHFPELASWRMNIVATDISREMIQRCREGRYSQLEVNRGLPAALLVKHFERVEMDWRIKDELRRMVDFREMNLASLWMGVPASDVIFMRNVLIYFDDAMKRQILGKVYNLLRPGGYLFLGGSETTLNLDSRFEQVKFDRTLCYRART
ncbi:CheR family methyltransferase [Plasticicumulans acidivorans]|uniref:protein-glutamate O-methyltransferase n=1 Tax=Plasticicumulans acidivorans TaxID=886464 RepID=A0A317MY32_9GAMM|nr:protein-glutamate O-methyltransferase CheR [Plasticicumulans acidivorans]PWV63252.1 chemotaxis protein methyltransferase CheR [Plasticicumulans acidivorans]